MTHRIDPYRVVGLLVCAVSAALVITLAWALLAFVVRP